MCFLESKVTDSLSYEKIISVLEPLCLDQELIKKYEKKMPLPATASPVKGGDENSLFSPSFASPSVLSPSTIFVGAPTKYEISTANHAFLAAHGEHPPAYCEYCFEVSNSVEETKLYSCESMFDTNCHSIFSNNSNHFQCHPLYSLWRIYSQELSSLYDSFV